MDDTIVDNDVVIVNGVVITGSCENDNKPKPIIDKRIIFERILDNFLGI